MRALYAIGVSLILGGCFYDNGNGYVPPHMPNAGDSVQGFSLSWKLVDARTNPPDPTVAPPITCDAAGVMQIEVRAHNQQTKEDFDFKFDCTASTPVYTPAVTAGDYDVSVDALDAGGLSKSHADWSQGNWGSSDLGIVVFLVNP